MIPITRNMSLGDPPPPPHLSLGGERSKEMLTARPGKSRVRHPLAVLVDSFSWRVVSPIIVIINLLPYRFYFKRIINFGLKLWMRNAN